MRETQELDIRIKIDSNRRDQLMTELAQHLDNGRLFIHERELWEEATKFTRVAPMTNAQRYGRFIHYMSFNVSAHPNYTSVVDYEKMYGVPREICQKMKDLNDGYEQLVVEWIEISKPAHGNNRDRA
jgi:hypothetical protein